MLGRCKLFVSAIVALVVASFTSISAAQGAFPAHHSFKVGGWELNMLHEPDGDVGEARGEAHVAQRDAVQKVPQLLTLEASQRDALGAPEAPRAAHRDALRAGQDFAEVRGTRVCVA